MSHIWDTGQNDRHYFKYLLRIYKKYSKRRRKYAIFFTFINGFKNNAIKVLSFRLHAFAHVLLEKFSLTRWSISGGIFFNRFSNSGLQLRHVLGLCGVHLGLQMTPQNIIRWSEVGTPGRLCNYHCLEFRTVFLESHVLRRNSSSFQFGYQKIPFLDNARNWHSRYFPSRLRRSRYGPIHLSSSLFRQFRGNWSPNARLFGMLELYRVFANSNSRR